MEGEATPTLQYFAHLVRPGGVFSSIFVIAAAWLSLRITRQFVDRLSNRFAQRRLLLQKLETFFQFFVYVATTVTVLLLSFRIDDRVLALLGGTAAVSVGFAIKDLVASFIAGLTVMIDRPFQVGDRIHFQDEYGDVVAIGLRSVRVRTLNDDIVTIPNNKFLNDLTKSSNYGDLAMQQTMDFYIGVDQDIGLARDIINEAAASSRYVHLPRPITVLVNQVITDNYLAIRLRLKAYVLDTRYEKLFETDVNMRVLDEFGRRGIKPPAILHRNVGERVTEGGQSAKAQTGV
ncbi:MAG: mechanosensitive ion channel [Myxococcales bacterium]|jgi:small-conductance mechanosensitive channel